VGLGGALAFFLWRVPVRDERDNGVDGATPRGHE
jgi:hypothetical protein